MGKRAKHEYGDAELDELDELNELGGNLKFLLSKIDTSPSPEAEGLDPFFFDEVQLTYVNNVATWVKANEKNITNILRKINFSNQEQQKLLKILIRENLLDNFISSNSYIASSIYASIFLDVSKSKVIQENEKIKFVRFFNLSLSYIGYLDEGSVAQVKEGIARFEILGYQEIEKVLREISSFFDDDEETDDEKHADIDDLFMRSLNSNFETLSVSSSSAPRSIYKNKLTVSEHIGGGDRAPSIGAEEIPPSKHCDESEIQIKVRLGRG